MLSSLVVPIQQYCLCAFCLQLLTPRGPLCLCQPLISDSIGALTLVKLQSNLQWCLGSAVGRHQPSDHHAHQLWFALAAKQV